MQLQMQFAFVVALVIEKRQMQLQIQMQIAFAFVVFSKSNNKCKLHLQLHLLLLLVLIQNLQHNCLSVPLNFWKFVDRISSSCYWCTVWMVLIFALPNSKITIVTNNRKPIRKKKPFAQNRRHHNVWIHQEYQFCKKHIVTKFTLLWANFD